MTKGKQPEPQEKAGHSRREREILDALYKLGKASAAEIREQIPDPPTYTAIRTHLSILEKKGHVRHESDGTRYIYEPLVAREQMGRRAIDSGRWSCCSNSGHYCRPQPSPRCNFRAPQ